ncbi:PAS domain-containing protein [Shewanella sp. YIC-542]|uniref:PAS domain-containing protein n=1 Tax=Shewanella mytili TaxID=3377111 RepID=UPI00398F1D3C
MLKKNPAFADMRLLYHLRGIHWSRQRLLAIASQLSMLIITIFLITNVLVTLGERRLQEEWAVQRYSELQTVGTLLADKISFQQFRTQMFSLAEPLKLYLQSPGRLQEQRLRQSWLELKDNTPELMDIALYDSHGKFRLASSNNFGNAPMTEVLLDEMRNLSSEDIYTSDVAFAPMDDRLEPYQVQVATLGSEQAVRGYLLTYNSLSQMLQSIKPAFSSNDSPLLLLDDQGQLYAGSSNLDPLSGIPTTLGSSLRQSYPTLWRELAANNFGEFHGEQATFVYLRISLSSANQEDEGEYVLLSYIRNSDINNRFTPWRNILLIAAGVVTLLAALVMIFIHLFRLEQRARLSSILLADGLFRSDLGYLLVNESGRIMCANQRAASILKQRPQEIENRSLQKLLEQDQPWYASLRRQLQQHLSWQGEVQLQALDNIVLRFSIRQIGEGEEGYALLSFEDISELKQVRQDAFLNRLLSDSAVATALVTPDGKLVRVNHAFDQLLQLDGSVQHTLTELLQNDLDNQWPRIMQLIAIHGIWQGQILCDDKTPGCLQTTLKSYQDDEGEISYLICTLESATHVREQPGSRIPHRIKVMPEIEDMENFFHALSPQEQRHSCLMLLDISPEALLSHMSEIESLESRQQQVETQVLSDLPRGYQMANWQLGKIAVLVPDTDANDCHDFAALTLENLAQHGLADGICIGIAAYVEGQTLQQFLNNAEIALKRAKQSGEGNICQAFTRQP